jgi:hypothetical protein
MANERLLDILFPAPVKKTVSADSVDVNDDEEQERRHRTR